MPDYPHSGDGRCSLETKPIDSASGYAALLLVESLIHHLISTKVLSVPEAIEIIDIASEVEREVSLTADDGLAPLGSPPSLAAMADSLRLDL